MQSSDKSLLMTKVAESRNLALPRPPEVEYAAPPLASTLCATPVNVHVHQQPGTKCPACAYLEQIAMPEDFAELEFPRALSLWLEAHKPYITDRTYKDYCQYADALCAFMGTLLVRHINFGTVRAYQMWRWKRGSRVANEMPGKYLHAAETVRIKNEINSVLKPLLREAGLWQAINDKKFKHLPVSDEGAGIALSKEQWRQLFDIAFEHKSWTLAGHCLQIMFRTGRGFGELRKIRRGDVDLAKGTIRINEGAKNKYRKGAVPLVPSALESVKWLVTRWEGLGGTSDEQYLLPHRATIRSQTLDRPMASINFAWNAIKAEWHRRLKAEQQANGKISEPVPDPRQYDARVSTATILLQNRNLSLPTIEKALGWTPSSAMRKRYHRAELENRREALNTLEDAG